MSVILAPLLWLGTTACGDNLLPAILAGESDHFRFFVDTSLALPPGIPADEVVTALEANFADFRTLLGMPDGRGKIDYYWLTDEHIRSQCPTQPGGACQLGERGGAVLAGSWVPHEHELIHAYASLLFTPHRPPLVLAEGLAEALGCVRGPSSVSTVIANDWRDVVTASHRNAVDVYGSGHLLVRYLILNYGMDRFLGYYGSAPRTDDAAAFAAHFAAFWSRDLEDVWTAMQTRSAPRGPPWVRPICPCGREPLSLPASAPQRTLSRSLIDPYWTLPNFLDDTLMMEGAPGVVWGDCRQELINYGMRRLLFSRVTSGRYLVTAHEGRISRGPYLSDRCDEAAAIAPYDLPADLAEPFNDVANVRVAFEGAAPPAAREHVTYLYWRPATRVKVVPRNSPLPTLAACTTCDFTAPDCQPDFSGRILEAGTAYHIRLTVRASALVPTIADLDVFEP